MVAELEIAEFEKRGDEGAFGDERDDLSQPLLPTKQITSIAVAASPTRIRLPI
jgi:hypothetical protein